MKMRFLTVVLAALTAVSCVPDWAKENDADILLLMDSVAGQKGGTDEEGATQLYSDVRNPGIINDGAELTLRAIAKNPFVDDSFADRGINDVFMKRYTVHYYRADGRSVQGVDVPHDISGEMAGRVPVNGELVTSIVVVRHQAKLEPPLRNLASPRDAEGNVRGIGGMQILTVFAEITVYGETPAKRTVRAKGTLEIHFADFADED